MLVMLRRRRRTTTRTRTRSKTRDPSRELLGSSKTNKTNKPNKRAGHQEKLARAARRRANWSWQRKNVRDHSGPVESDRHIQVYYVEDRRKTDVKPRDIKTGQGNCKQTQACTNTSMHRHVIQQEMLHTIEGTKRTNQRTNERTNERTSECADVRTDGRTDGQTNKQTNKERTEQASKQASKRTGNPKQDEPAEMMMPL